MPREPRRGNTQHRRAPLSRERTSQVAQATQASFSHVSNHHTFDAAAGQSSGVPLDYFYPHASEVAPGHLVSSSPVQTPIPLPDYPSFADYRGASCLFEAVTDLPTPAISYTSHPAHASQVLSNVFTEGWLGSPGHCDLFSTGSRTTGAALPAALPTELPHEFITPHRPVAWPCETLLDHNCSLSQSFPINGATQHDAFHQDPQRSSIQPDAVFPPPAPTYMYLSEIGMSGFQGQRSHQSVAPTSFENVNLLCGTSPWAGHCTALAGTQHATPSTWSSDTVRDDVGTAHPLPKQNLQVDKSKSSAMPQTRITPYPHYTVPTSSNEWDPGWLLLRPASDERTYMASRSASHCLTVNRASGASDTYVALHGSVRPGPELHLYLKAIYPTIAGSGAASELRRKAIRGRLKGILLRRLTNTIEDGSLFAAVHAAGHDSTVSAAGSRSIRNKAASSAPKADHGEADKATDSLPRLGRVLDPLANRMEWMPGWLEVNREQVTTFLEGAELSANTAQPQHGSAFDVSGLSVDRMVPQHEPILHFRRIRGANAQAAQATWDDLAGKTLHRPNDSVVQLYSKNKSPYITEPSDTTLTPKPFWRRIVMGSVELYNAQIEQCES